MHSRLAIRWFRKTRRNPSTAPSTARKGGNPIAHPQLVQNLLTRQATKEQGSEAVSNSSEPSKRSAANL